MQATAIDAQIEQGLDELAHYLGADAAALLRTRDTGAIELAHQCFSLERGPLPSHSRDPASHYDWVRDRLGGGAQVIEMHEQSDLRCVGLIPTYAGDAIAGAICLDYGREATPPPADALHRFEVLADVLLGAVRRRDADLAEQEMAHRLETLGRLASGVAHDINNQLTIVVAHAHLGERAATDATKKSFEAIETAALHASSIARELLKLVEDGSIPILDPPGDDR